MSVEKIKKEKNEAVKGLEEKINKKVKELEQTKNELESEKEKIEKLNKELIDNIKSSTLEINQQIESENSNESENKNKKKYVYIDVKHYPANPSLLSRLLAKATDDITKKLDQAKEIKI